MAAPAPRTIDFAIAGPIGRGDLPELCRRLGAIVDAQRAAIAFCDVRGIEADAVTIDALARLALAARRRGCRLRLRHASDELRELLTFVGLRDALSE